MSKRLLLVRVAAVATLAASLPLAACEGMDNPFGPNPDEAMPDNADYVRTKALEVPEFDFLWERAKFMLQTDGYGIDNGRTSRNELKLVSQWNTILAPVRYHGKRRRIVMRFEEAPGGRWVVATGVVVQRNEDIQDPLSIARAVWKSDAPDTSRAEVFTYKLETGFSDAAERKATETP